MAGINDILKVGSATKKRIDEARKKSSSRSKKSSSSSSSSKKSTSKSTSVAPTIKNVFNKVTEIREKAESPEPPETSSTSSKNVVERVSNLKENLVQRIESTKPSYVSPASQKISKLSDKFKSSTGKSIVPGKTLQAIDNAYINRQKNIYKEKKAEIERLSKLYQSATTDQDKAEYRGALSQAMMEAEQAGAKAGITEDLSVSFASPISSVFDRAMSSNLPSNIKGGFAGIKRMIDLKDKQISPEERDLNIEVRKIADREMATGSISQTDWNQAAESRNNILDSIKYVSNQSSGAKFTIGNKQYSKAETLNYLNNALDSIKITYGDKEYIPGEISYDDFKNQATDQYRENIVSQLQKPDNVNISDKEWNDIVRRYKAREIGITGVNQALIEASIPDLPDVYKQGEKDVLGIEPEYRNIMRKVITGQITQDEAETLLTAEFNKHLAMAEPSTLYTWIGWDPLTKTTRGEGKETFLKYSLQKDIADYEEKYKNIERRSKGKQSGMYGYMSVEDAKKWIEANKTPEKYAEEISSQEGALVDWDTYYKQHPDKRALKLEIDESGMDLGTIFKPTLDYKMAEKQEFDELKGVGPDISVLDIASSVFPPAGLAKSSMNLAGIKDTSPSLSAGQWSKAFVVGATQFPKTVYTLASAIPPALESGDYVKEYTEQLQPQLYEAGYGIRKAVDIGHKTGDWTPYVREIGTSPAVTDVILPLTIGAGFSAASPLISGAGGKLASGAGTLGSKIATKIPRATSVLAKGGSKIASSRVGSLAIGGGKYLGRGLMTPYGMSTAFFAPSAVDIGAQTALYQKGDISREEWIASLQRGAQTGFQLGMFSYGATYQPTGAMGRFKSRAQSARTRYKTALSQAEKSGQTILKPKSVQRLETWARKGDVSGTLPESYQSLRYKGYQIEGKTFGIKTGIKRIPTRIKTFGTGVKQGIAKRSLAFRTNISSASPAETFMKPSQRLTTLTNKISSKYTPKFTRLSRKISSLESKIPYADKYLSQRGINLKGKLMTARTKVSNVPRNLKLKSTSLKTNYYKTRIKGLGYDTSADITSVYSKFKVPKKLKIGSAKLKSSFYKARLKGFGADTSGDVTGTFIKAGQKVKGKITSIKSPRKGITDWYTGIKRPVAGQMKVKVTSPAKTKMTNIYRAKEGSIRPSFRKEPITLKAKDARVVEGYPKTSTTPEIDYQRMKLYGASQKSGQTKIGDFYKPKTMKQSTLGDFGLKVDYKGVPTLAKGGGLSTGMPKLRQTKFALKQGETGWFSIGGEPSLIKKSISMKNILSSADDVTKAVSEGGKTVGGGKGQTSIVKTETVVKPEVKVKTKLKQTKLTDFKTVEPVVKTVKRTEVIPESWKGVYDVPQAGVVFKPPVQIFKPTIDLISKPEVDTYRVPSLWSGVKSIQKQDTALKQKTELDYKRAQLQDQAYRQTYVPMLASDVAMDYDTQQAQAQAQIQLPEVALETPTLQIETPKTKVPLIPLPGDEEELKKKRQRKSFRPYSTAYRERMFEVPDIWKQATTKKQWGAQQKQRPITKKPKFIKLTR